MCPEVGIYKRKQESKKTRKQKLEQESDQENKKKRKKTGKQELDQESGQENKKKERKQELDQESDQENKIVFFFLINFLVEFLFLVFFYKFPPRCLWAILRRQAAATGVVFRH